MLVQVDECHGTSGAYLEVKEGGPMLVKVSLWARQGAGQAVFLPDMGCELFEVSESIGVVARAGPHWALLPGVDLGVMWRRMFGDVELDGFWL